MIHMTYIRYIRDIREIRVIRERREIIDIDKGCNRYTRDNKDTGDKIYTRDMRE